MDDVRSRTGLASIIGRKVKLTRAGREWKGCCPFHDEKTPSFYVNEEKGFYHCFGCGAHGDAISFLMEQEGLPFIDAVKALAAEVGLELPPLEHSSPQADRRAGLYELISEAGAWYNAQLQSSAGASARDYLSKRAVSPALTIQFGLGFAPDSRDALSKALKAKFDKVEPNQLLEAGLVGETEGRRYDRFRGRLMFPIHDPRGRPVGFGGRILGNGEPKYLNSPEGPVFHKGRLLYNYHRAAPAARKSGTLFIVEGYMDVVALVGAGIPEAVAPLGTALTEEQIQLCWKSTDSPILSFDGDGAGQRAAMRSALRILPILVPGKSARILTLPKGLDPDDFTKANGRSAFLELARESKILSDYVYEQIEATSDVGSPEGRVNFIKTLKEISSTIQNYELQREFFIYWRKRAISTFTENRFGSNRRENSLDNNDLKIIRSEISSLKAPNRIVEAMVLSSFARRKDANDIEHFSEELVMLDLYYPSLSGARVELLENHDVSPNRLRGVYELLPREISSENFRTLMKEVLGSLIEISELRVMWMNLKETYSSDYEAAHSKQRIIGAAAMKNRERLMQLVSDIADARAAAKIAA
nr:DNA primase [Sandaracinobacteroides sayramensis]